MEQILSWFHTNQIPTEWLTPKITISELDWDVIIDEATMDDVWWWCYAYDFLEYDKTLKYLITADWDNANLDDIYQHTTNFLDSYDNKTDWGKWGGGWWYAWENIDYKRIVKDVWGQKDIDMKPWTVWSHIFDLNTDEVVNAINKKDIDLWPIVDYIKKWNNKIINEIKKIPDQTEQINALADFIDAEINKLNNNISDNNDVSNAELKNIVSLIPKEIDYKKVQSFHKEIDFSPLLKFMWDIKQLVKKGNNDIELLNIENIDYGIIKDFIDDNKKEFQDIVSNISWKLEINKDLLVEQSTNTDTIENLVHIWEKIEELKQVESQVNDLNRKYLFSIYNIVNGISNQK